MLPLGSVPSVPSCQKSIYPTVPPSMPFVGQFHPAPSESKTFQCLAAVMPLFFSRPKGSRFHLPVSP